MTFPFYISSVLCALVCVFFFKVKMAEFFWMKNVMSTHILIALLPTKKKKKKNHKWHCYKVVTDRQKNNFSCRFKLRLTTRKLSYCGGPIAAGAKTAAICRQLRRIFGSLLYMRSIAVFNMPAVIALVFCGVLQRRANDPSQ